MTMIRPRKIEGWEFFDAHVDACDAGGMQPLEALTEPDRQVPEFFVRALAGYRKVLDLGCGGGYPGLYVAPHVGELVGLDAAPKMIEAALTNAAALGAGSARFEAGGADGILPYADAEFDGAMLCGVLESMNWKSVHRIMPELRRVLALGARLAALDQDWQERLAKVTGRARCIRIRDGRLILQIVERRSSPHVEIDTRYYLNRYSEVHRMMLRELADRTIMRSPLDVDDLRADDVLDAEYDEMAQFDARSLAELFEAYGFRGVSSEAVNVPAWSQNMVLLTARG